VSRAQVLGFRVRAQQLDRVPGSAGRRLADTAVLDLGVQNTGPDGGRWALALRGVDVSGLPGRQLVLLWTLRGAPHFYRRADLPKVAAAVEPFSDTDAGKRIFDAAKPLQAAGIGNLAALDAVAAAMRSVVVAPMSKGELSTRLTSLMEAPFLRYCRACQATHVSEQPFRLAALRAGLELRPDTSPPVLERIPRFAPGQAAAVSKQHDPIRGYLRLLGPATPQQVAGFLDAPAKEVRARWPADAVEVTVDGQTRWVLAADQDRLAVGPAAVTRLLGPFDLFLQAQDRPLLAPDPARARTLWPRLGRPGAVLLDGEIGGTWRARRSGTRLALQVDPWTTLRAPARSAINEQAELLATFRQASLSKVDFAPR